jgi:tetratricopeptide (TPR) repeat protein
MRWYLLLLFSLSLCVANAQGPDEAKLAKQETKARKLIADGKPYKAIEVCDRFLGEVPQPRFHVVRADALNRVGEHAKAERDARAALAAKPVDDEVLLQLAIAEQGLGQRDSAIAHLDRLVQRVATPVVRYQLALAYQASGRCADALTQVEMALGSTGDIASKAHRLKGECAALQGDSATAHRELDQAVALAPRDPVNYNSRGFFAFAHFGLHQRAIQDYDRAIKLNPNYSYAFNNRGWSRYKSGDKQRALKDIAQAAQRKASNPYIYRNLGVIALESGDTDKACSEFRKAIDHGFTALHGDEVEKLMTASCTGTKANAPVQTPNAPLDRGDGKPPVRSNAP